MPRTRERPSKHPDPLIISREGRIYSRAVFGAAALLVLAIVLWAAGQRGWPSALAMLMSACLGGMTMIVGALYFRRHPSAIRQDEISRCVRCKYPVESGFDRCPECGAALDRPNAVVTGHPETLGDTWFVTALIGVAMIASGFFLVWLLW